MEVDYWETCFNFEVLIQLLLYPQLKNWDACFQMYQYFILKVPLTSKLFCKSTPVSQMEVGCSRVWGLKPTTQTQVGGTPHKPALPATQAWAPPTTPNPKSSTHNTKQWVQWKTIEERPLLRRGNTRKYTSATTPNAKPSKTMRSRWPLELPKTPWKSTTRT